MEAILLIAFFLLIALPGPRVLPRVSGVPPRRRTPRMFGRLTLNPIAHFHPVGGTMLVISVLVAGFRWVRRHADQPGQPARSLRRGDRRGSRTALEPAAGCRRRHSTAIRPRSELQFEFPILAADAGLFV